MVWFNPFTLSLELREIKIPEPDGTRFFSLQSAGVNLSMSSLWSRALVFDEVGVDQLFVHVVQLPDASQDMEHVAEAREPSTGLPVISLYGDKVESLRPRPARLRDLDAVVVDLQDVGSRYYTFVYTLSFVMEAAASVGLPVVVLDRPNPIGGRHVEGPVLHPEWTSFVGRYPLPVRHGMTAGELARLFNDREGIGCDLAVVPCRGWTREFSPPAT